MHTAQVLCSYRPLVLSDIDKHVFLQTDTGSTGQQYKRMLFILGIGVSLE